LVACAFIAHSMSSGGCDGCAFLVGVFPAKLHPDGDEPHGLGKDNGSHPMNIERELAAANGRNY
jgi:hypothetical protein